MEQTSIETKSEKEVALNSRAGQLVAAAERAVVDTDETEVMGTDLAKLFRTAISRVEAERLEIALPIDRGLRTFNARFKVISSALTKGRLVIDKKVLDYKKAVQAKLDKEERERREAREEQEEKDRLAAVAEGKADSKGDVDPGFDPQVPDPDEPEPAKRAPVRTNIATSSVKKDWTYEVEDIAELAKSHPGLVMEKGGEIRKLIAKGEREIPGLRIYQKESLAVR